MKFADSARRRCVKVEQYPELESRHNRLDVIDGPLPSCLAGAGTGIECECGPKFANQEWIAEKSMLASQRRARVECTNGRRTQRQDSIGSAGIAEYSASCKVARIVDGRLQGKNGQ